MSISGCDSAAEHTRTNCSFSASLHTYTHRALPAARSWLFLSWPPGTCLLAARQQRQLWSMKCLCQLARRETSSPCLALQHCLRDPRFCRQCCRCLQLPVWMIVRSNACLHTLAWAHASCAVSLLLCECYSTHSLTSSSSATQSRQVRRRIAFVRSFVVRGESCSRLI